MTADPTAATLESRLARWRDIGPVVTVGLLAAVFAIVFFRLALLRHDRYGTFGFDLGIYDQGAWLVSRGHNPFVTVRGIDLFGHHVNLVFLFLAPFYALGAGPEFLLLVQVLAQASGAFAVYLLARDRLGARWPGVVLAAILLLHPTYQWLMWEFFHPDAVSIAPLLFAYWAAREERWGWFTVAATVALACKEDVSLAIAVLGVLVAFRSDRVKGVSIAALGAVWFVIATRLIIPWRNGIGPFYDAFFGDLGSSPGEVLGTLVRHPTRGWRLLTADDRLTWYLRMWAPVGFMPVVALDSLVIALPMIAINILTAFPYTRDFRFHYSSLVVAGTIVATVEGLARVSRGDRWIRNFLLVALLGSALWTSHLWGPSPIGRDYDGGYWPLREDPRVALKTEALSVLPEDAATSAAYNLLPHIGHRRQVYEFPVPWCNINWGVEGENLDDAAEVEWLAVDRQLLGERDRRLLDDLLAREFAVRFDEADLVVAERVAPPAIESAATPLVGACREREGVDLNA